MLSFATLAVLAAATPIEPSVERLLPRLLETYRHLHTHPEVSGQEKETSARLAQELRALGYQVTERVGRYADKALVSYGMVAVLENGAGPRVLLRTDLDGLPVEEKTGAAYASRAKTADGLPAMHACGHDVHMTAFLGVATLLAERKNEWRGTLMLVGQPAEETGTGAKALLDGGLYDKLGKPDFALAWHVKAELPAGTIGIRPGFALANVDSVDITVRGVGGHGAFPHTTKDPVVLASELVVMLQTLVSRERPPLAPAVVTVGSIHGGSKHNIIPDEVKLQLTVRSYAPDVRAQLLSGIKRMAEGLAVANGLPKDRAPIVTVLEDESTPATYNDPGLTERLAKSLRARFGDAHVVEVDSVMGGEDFGRYSLGQKIPSALLWLGAVEPTRKAPLPSLHSSEFLPAAEPALRTGVTAMTAAILELMHP